VRRLAALLAACASGSAFVALALATSGGAAYAEETGATAAPTPSAAAPGAGAPTTALAPSDAPAPAAPATKLPPFESEAFGDETSKSPTPEEWKTAKELAPTRRSARADGCHVYRVREWVRVSCPDKVTASMSLLGGAPTGISFWIDPPREGDGGKLPAGGEVQFPVKKGDRRVVQLLTFGKGYEGPFTQLPALVVQELWLEGAAAPVLVLY